ncbi:hypothetical protein QMK33_16935 [Hymenobacter sp. H14-R3]|nr:hypothetical protein [Hymenobacter sp. H14-R3]MDJ0366841.1 hypothetical protein [Hymenobacter sp. H14-R3]
MRQLALLVQHMATAAGYRAARVGIGTPGTTIPKNGLMKKYNYKVLEIK